MSRSTATKVGHIECPLCHVLAQVKKSSRGKQQLFINCPDCGQIINGRQNYQHYINQRAVFDDEPRDNPEATTPTSPEPEPTVNPEESPKPAPRKAAGSATWIDTFFGDDDD